MADKLDDEFRQQLLDAIREEVSAAFPLPGDIREAMQHAPQASRDGP